MRNLDPEIPLQHDLARQLYHALQGDVVSGIRNEVYGDIDLIRHSRMKSHSLHVTESILPDLYSLCQEVLKALDFNEPTDFYITGTAEVNAAAIGSDDPEKKPHIIEINSALFNLMSEDELRYVIGHEVGHLINRDFKILNLYHFIYNDDEALDKVPEFIEKRYDLWGRIAELSADRYGYMACENLSACITAIFKMASGLRLDLLNIRISDLMNLNQQNLDFLLNESMCMGGTHPVNPVRIQALHLFEKAKTQKALVDGMITLLGIISNSFYTDADYDYAELYAAVGLLVCGGNGKLEKRAEEMILNKVAEYSLHPAKVLKGVAKSDLPEIVKRLMPMAENDGCDTDILRFVIDLVFVDNIIEPSELECIKSMGSALGFAEAQIAEILTSKIRAHFAPQACLMK